MLPKLLIFALTLLQIFPARAEFVGRQFTSEEWENYHYVTFMNPDREQFYNEMVQTFETKINPHLPAVNDIENFLFTITDGGYRGTVNAEDNAPTYNEWDKKLLQYLVQKRGLNINQQVNDNTWIKESPLFKAARNCNVKMVKDLVAFGADYRPSFRGNSFNFQSNILTHATFCGSKSKVFSMAKYFLGELKIYPANSLEFCSGMFESTNNNELWDYYVSLGGDSDTCSRLVGLSN
jgi:hypothetical protein